MKDKIIVLDLDGTLLSSNETVDLETTNYLQELDKSNTIVLASGRSYHEIIEIKQNLKIKGPIITQNGASLIFDDRINDVILSITNTTIKDIFSSCKDVIISAFYTEDNNIYIQNKMDKLSFLYKIKDNSNVIIGDFENLDLKNPNSIYLILNNDKKDILFNKINNEYSNELEYLEYGHDKKYSITIISMKNTDKAYAILELLLIMGKTLDDLIIFGDGYKDIKMLSLDAHTVAMKNASDEVKQVSKYQTEFDNNNQGVLKYLKSIDN